MLVGENRYVLRENVKSQKLSVESDIFFRNRGKSETGVNASLPHGIWTPLERGDLGQEITCTFIDKIRKRRLTRFGLVTRMENSRLPAVALYNQEAEEDNRRSRWII